LRASEVAIDSGVGGLLAVGELAVAVTGHLAGEQAPLALAQRCERCERLDRCRAQLGGPLVAGGEPGDCGGLERGYAGVALEQPVGLVAGEDVQPAGEALAALGWQRISCTYANEQASSSVCSQARRRARRRPITLGCRSR
jgi:hypothetical protein